MQEGDSLADGAVADQLPIAAARQGAWLTRAVMAMTILGVMTFITTFAWFAFRLMYFVPIKTSITGAATLVGVHGILVQKVTISNILKCFDKLTRFRLI